MAKKFVDTILIIANFDFYLNGSEFITGKNVTT